MRKNNMGHEDDVYRTTCDTCDWNDDNLCDKMGHLINEDDEACTEYEHNKKE